MDGVSHYSINEENERYKLVLLTICMGAVRKACLAGVGEFDALLWAIRAEECHAKTRKEYRKALLCSELHATVAVAGSVAEALSTQRGRVAGSTPIPNRGVNSEQGE
jgi:hypothetical protein